MKAAPLTTNCWVIVDEGITDLESQCVILSDALGLAPSLFRVRRSTRRSYLPPWLWSQDHLPFAVRPREFPETKPHVIIAGGEFSLKVAAFFNRRYKTFSIAIGKLSLRSYNFHAHIVLGIKHYQWGKYMGTLGPLHSLTSHILGEARKKYYGRFGMLPSPHIAFLLSDREYPLLKAPEYLHRLAQTLKNLAQRGSLLIHLGPQASRDNALCEWLQHQLYQLTYFLWQGQGEDPYLGMCAFADYFIVGLGFENELTEIASLGKPAYFYIGDEIRPSITPLQKNLLKNGYYRYFKEDGDLYSPIHLSPLNEAKRIAEKLKPQIEIHTMNRPCA